VRFGGESRKGVAPRARSKTTIVPAITVQSLKRSFFLQPPVVLRRKGQPR